MVFKKSKFEINYLDIYLNLLDLHLKNFDEI